MQKISTCLWFDREAEEAAKFYVSIFKDSKIVSVNHYMKDMPMPEGTVLSVAFTLQGEEVLALNGGSVFKLSPAVSLMVKCENQAEVDEYWRKFLEGGGKESQCGWLTDRFGLSWQIVPRVLLEMTNSSDKAAVQRTLNAMMKMIKLDIAKLEQAYAGA